MTRAALAIVFVGCTQTVQLANDHLSNLVTIEVTPSDTAVEITDLAQPAQEIRYAAIGRFEDGTTRDVTELVDWTVDNPAPGQFTSRGSYATSNLAGGHVAIAATGHGLSASARLTVTIRLAIVDATFPPPGTGLFDPSLPVVSGDPQHSPQLLYPADATMFPQGVSRTLFQYIRGMNNVASQLSFDSDVFHLVVLTGSDRWQADGALQQVIAGSGIDGPIQLVISGTASNGSGTIYASLPRSLAFSRDAPTDTITYWSAATNGVMRGTLATITATKLYPSASTCVGCHAIARGGNAMAMGYNGETLQTIALPTMSTTISASAKIPMGWASYSPDGHILAVTHKGVLSLFDAATAAPIGSVDGRVQLPPMRWATHPDWSPDGAYLAVAYTTTAPNNMDVKTASIARLPYHDGAFGPPEILVAGSPTDNNYFPRWSPDGRFIAYVHATTSSHGAPTAELQLFDNETSQTRVLRLASHRVGVTDDVPDLASMMPAWVPSQGDHAWLAFSSSRPYGAVVPAGGRGQIWIAAIDEAASGDPSAPAFWLPCQDVTVLNNNPAWGISPAPEQ